MNNLDKLFVDPEASIKEAIEVMDTAGQGIALVIDKNKLCGLVTDGDIRRAILKEVDLNNKIKSIMNINFSFVTKNYTKTLIDNIFNIKHIRHIPVVDDNMSVIDIIFHDDFYTKSVRENYALIMAGGLGKRLRPLTQKMPKPMLKIGLKPILQVIIEQLKSFGFVNILISVNYKSEIIKNYFEDGSNFGVKIKYIEEKKRLGTAGSIKLAQKFLNKDFFVINGDVLTKLDFTSLMEHHIKEKNMLTITTRKYELNVPYGVVKFKNNVVYDLNEKPTYNFFINSGIYCINPNVINYIPYNKFYDITTLINTLINSNNKVDSFPIREYWIDIGRVSDYEKANKDYYKLFGSYEIL